MHKYGFLEKILFQPVYLYRKKLAHALEGKTVLITGASSGIGEELAYMLADLKVHLILVARREDRLLEVKSEVEKKTAKVTIFKADLRDDKDMKTLLEFLHQLPEGLDIVVSNAGKSIRRPIKDSLDRYHDFTRTMAVNYFAPVQLLLSIIPLLKKNNGHIINISTVNALLMPIPYWAAYQASKGAFDIWLRSAAPELKAMGIRATTIYLPLVRTPMILPTEVYRKMPAMSPNQVGRIICRAIYTRKRKYSPWWLVFGQLASVLFRGAWEALIPRAIGKRRKKS